jgi:hypothetical protein
MRRNSKPKIAASVNRKSTTEEPGLPPITTAVPDAYLFSRDQPVALC